MTQKDVPHLWICTASISEPDPAADTPFCTRTACHDAEGHLPVAVTIPCHPERPSTDHPVHGPP
jgi:hypothetical protein